MNTELEVMAEIEKMKKLLTTTAEEHNFDLQHPSVLHLSHQLDLLIIKSMKNQDNNSSYSFDSRANSGMNMYEWLMQISSSSFELSLSQSKAALHFIEFVTDLQQQIKTTGHYPIRKNSSLRYFHGVSKFMGFLTPYR